MVKTHQQDEFMPNASLLAGRGASEQLQDGFRVHIDSELSINRAVCTGHDILMATMLNGAAVMDGALLLIAANETCPQPQTSEHLAAVEIMRLEHIIILQNKIDLIRYHFFSSLFQYQFS